MQTGGRSGVFPMTHGIIQEIHKLDYSPANHRRRRLALLAAVALVCVLPLFRQRHVFEFLDFVGTRIRIHRLETYHDPEGTVLWDSFPETSSILLRDSRYHAFGNPAEPIALYKQSIWKDWVREGYLNKDESDVLILFSHRMVRPDGVERLVVVDFYPMHIFQLGPFDWSVFQMGTNHTRCKSGHSDDPLVSYVIESSYLRRIPFRITLETADVPAPSEFYFRLDHRKKQIWFVGRLDNRDRLSIQTCRPTASRTENSYEQMTLDSGDARNSK